MQVTVDGYSAGPNGELDWMTWNWDDKLKARVIELTDSIDTILMGRKMTEGFMSYWTNVKPDSPEYPFAKKMVDAPKFVFTKTLVEHNWVNTNLVKGDLTEEVTKLKMLPGKDMIVYGGAGFVSSLVDKNLIDEYHLFINPAIIGKGLSIFGTPGLKLNLKLESSTVFECGIVINVYSPKK